MSNETKRVQEIAAAYYDDKIDYDQLRSLVGAEDASNFRVLKQQLEDDFVDSVVDL